MNSNKKDVSNIKQVSNTQKFNIPLTDNEDKIIFQIVVDKAIYEMARKNNNEFNVSIIVQTDSPQLNFDLVRHTKDKKLN
jgi:hypothetical protein